MNSYKGLLPLATIALIGLAGVSAAFAQGSIPIKCDTGEMVFKDGNGIEDNFAGNNPHPHPSAQLVADVNLVTGINIYDQKASNYHFGDTFTLNPPGQITKIWLRTHLRANSPDANNDGISFSAKPSFTVPPTNNRFGFALNTLAPGWGSSVTNKVFLFEFTATTVLVNGGAFPILPTYPTTFYTDLNLNRTLHVYVQDDTSVDFIQIEGCYKPTPKFDLVATKKHDANLYILNVTNAGQPISPSGKVDVTEIVPAGLTIDSATGTSWTCPGVVFPVVGPDAFTCTYPIPNTGIPTGNLPPIVLKSEGKAECPNCMRVRLYLNAVSDGKKPVEEGDMKNNASCTN